MPGARPVCPRSVRQPYPPSPEIQVIQSTENRELLAAVGRLEPLEQELLRLRTWEELSLAEIASVVELSVRSVESRLARVRKKLRASLGVPKQSPHLSGPREPAGAGSRGSWHRMAVRRFRQFHWSFRNPAPEKA